LKNTFELLLSLIFRLGGLLFIRTPGLERQFRAA
jgi:hypothetical protein